MSGGPPGTRWRRPGTPGQEATPATASARSTPPSTRATIAPRALATLKAPGRVTDASASTPPGPSIRKLAPGAAPPPAAARPVRLRVAPGGRVGAERDDRDRRLGDQPPAVPVG